MRKVSLLEGGHRVARKQTDHTKALAPKSIDRGSPIENRTHALPPRVRARGTSGDVDAGRPRRVHSRCTRHAATASDCASSRVFAGGT